MGDTRGEGERRWRGGKRNRCGGRGGTVRTGEENKKNRGEREVVRVIREKERGGGGGGG